MAPNATLAAGRELDALVAERVMGYSRESEYLLSPDPYVGRVGAWVGNHFSAYGDALPTYSTNIAAAWEVVGMMMRTRAFNLICEPGLNDGAWYCEFIRALEPTRVGQATTAPLAICRAALAAATGGAS